MPQVAFSILCLPDHTTSEVEGVSVLLSTSAKCLDYRRACAVTANCCGFHQNASAQEQPLFQLRHLSGLWFQGSNEQFRDVNVHLLPDKKSAMGKESLLTGHFKGPLNLLSDLAIQEKRKEEL